jgi:hypothetical protein
MTLLTLECRIERGRPESVRNPDPSAVSHAIRRLDGEVYNSLTLVPEPVGPSSPDFLSVSGGRGHRYLVGYHERGGEIIWYAAEPDRGDRLEENVVGGQGTELPARWWVTQGIALEAADFFIEHQTRDPDLVWEPDPGLMPAT